MASVHESCWMNELFVNAAEVGGDTALSKTETTFSRVALLFTSIPYLPLCRGRDVCA